VIAYVIECAKHPEYMALRLPKSCPTCTAVHEFVGQAAKAIGDGPLKVTVIRKPRWKP
jgi:hypothetical protein